MTGLAPSALATATASSPIGPGPIGLLAVAVAKALGASPVILTGTRNGRLAIGRELGADRVVNINDEDAVEVVRQLTGGIGADSVAPAPYGVAEGILWRRCASRSCGMGA